jgi:long-chain acyl-CoA synthetase
MTEHAPIARPPIVVDGTDTPGKLFRLRAQQWAGRPALRHKRKGIWHSTSWREYYANARAIGLALREMGVRPGDVVSILSENRPEWVYADLAAQCMGFISNGVYPTNSPEQVQYILQNSSTRVLFIENEEQFDKVRRIRAACPELGTVIVTELKGLRGVQEPWLLTFADLLARGHELARQQAEDFERAIDSTRPEAVGFLVYTSGTTGAPKGAMLLNRNLMFQVSVARQYVTIKTGDKTVSFLPLCHIAERMGTVYNQLAAGQIVHFPENAGTVANDIREVAPDLIFAPPRFWEKMHSAVTLTMQDAIAPAQWFYRWAFAEGQALSGAILENRPVAPWRRLRFTLLQRLVLSNVRTFLGLQNVRNAITGAAPVPPDLLKWYMAIGISLIEGYGATETSGFCSMTPEGRVRIGYAGVKARGTEIRIGPDDEILVRGDNVFAGYWRMPEKTAEALDADGWLHTGDCGELDADGYLRIKDRIKDIIITSGGKNITPSAIEHLLKLSPYVADAVVVGEGRNYLTCLVMIDQDNVAKFAQEQQIPYTDFASLTQCREVIDLVRGEVEMANARLARVEQIKDFRIIDQILTAEDEELTPTMKLKRKVVARKYADLIAGMYT